MSLIWLIVIGLIVSAVAKLLMPEQGAGGLFVLGIGGAMIAGTIQYSVGHAVGVIAPFAGAVILLGVHAVIGRRPPATPIRREETQEDFRRAA